MTPNRAEIEARLSGIRREFLARCREQLDTLDTMASSLAETGSSAEGARALGIVHRIAGASGTFAFKDLSRTAGSLEDAIRASTDARAVGKLLAERTGSVRTAVATAMASVEGKAR